jgi:thymidylate kinase
LKIIVIDGIDCSGKSTEIAKLPFKNKIKYPNDKDIKDAINKYYRFLTRSGAELHDDVRRTIYENIHDLYDRDFRMDVNIPNPEESVLILDRYFISNVVYARMHGVGKPIYYEDHLLEPDLVIMLKIRDYPRYKNMFIKRGDQFFRDPAVLYEEHQPIYQAVLKELLQKRVIKKYTIIEGLCDDTNQKIRDAIGNIIDKDDHQ